MIRAVRLIIPLCLLFFSCCINSNQKSIEKWKQEILDTEKAFAKMVKEKGIHIAFTTFAAEDAVLMRNDKLIIGKEEIAERYKDVSSNGLEWEPEFIDVSTSGDLAYTYGQYTYSSIDSTGNVIEEQGIFHTVWKRQSDGSWRFVWD